MIEVQGSDGESLVFDGTSIAKYRHFGKQEAARNLARTFRDAQVTPRKRKKKDPEQRYDVLLACGAFFSLTITEAQLPEVEQLVAALRAASAAG